jgi:hypothetical protein
MSPSESVLVFLVNPIYYVFSILFYEAVSFLKTKRLLVAQILLLLTYSKFNT